MAKQPIKRQSSPTDYWPHAHLFADSGGRLSRKFRSDLWTGYRVAQRYSAFLTGITATNQ